MIPGPAVFRGGLEDEPYGVELDVFEGPLDLLLYLIKKDEIDIWDIPIAYITRQYLEYVELMRVLNLEQAGNFLLMAATLMEIKAQMLLPRTTGEEMEEDPREELVRRLLEYQRYKELSGWLEERETEQKDVFYRVAHTETERGDMLRPVSLFELLTAFKVVMESTPKAFLHQISGTEVSMDERIEFVLTVLEEKERVAFLDLVLGVERDVFVVTFIAILELIRVQKIVARQSRLYGEIWLYRKTSSSDTSTVSGRDG